MGLFSKKKKIYVSSSVADLNGSNHKALFVPGTLVQGAIAGQKQLGKYLMDELFNGQGIKLRRFYTWSVRSGYSNFIGSASSEFYTDIPINKEKLIADLTLYLNLAPNQNIELGNCYIGWYDDEYIVENWIQYNRPDLVGKLFNVETTLTAIGTYRVKEYVTYYDSEGSPYKVREWVTKTNYRQDIKITVQGESPIVITKDHYDESKRFFYLNYTINTTQQTVIPGTPTPEEPNPPDTIITEIIDTKDFFEAYQESSGKPYLDAYFTSGSVTTSSYFPFIPLMHEGKWVVEGGYGPEAYSWAKKAYKKLRGGNSSAYNKFVKELRKSKGIDECKFIYQQIAIPITTVYQAGLGYIFEFFYNLYLNKNISSGNKKGTLTKEDIKRLIRGDRESIFIKSTSGLCNFQNRIEWNQMVHRVKRGTIFDGAKRNNYSIKRIIRSVEYDYWDYDSEGYPNVLKTGIKEYKSVMLLHQITNKTYEELEVWDLRYFNVIYGGKAVEYLAYDELDPDLNIDKTNLKDTDPGDSGFLIPIEYWTFKELGLIRGQDLTSGCMFLVCNSYKVKRVRWYQRLFKPIIAIVAVVLSVFTGGSSLTAIPALVSAGFADVAMSIVADAVISAVIGAIIGTIAGKLLMPILVKAFSALFGEKIGNILGAIVSVVISAYCCSSFQGTTLSWGEMCNSTNLMKLSIAGLDGYSQYLQTSANNIMHAGTQLISETQNAINSINSKYEEMFSSHSLISKQQLYDALYIPEPPTAYFSRTLMTGADIANQSLDMLTGFPNYSIDLTLAGI
mgnify:CR=1 FL=1